MVHVLSSVLKGRFETFECAFTLGECLLSGCERFLFGCGLRALCLFQRGPIVIQAAAFAFDRIPLAGNLLVGKLPFELLFLLDRFPILPLKLSQFLLRSGAGFVASGDAKDGNRQKQNAFHDGGGNLPNAT